MKARLKVKPRTARVRPKTIGAKPRAAMAHRDREGEGAAGSGTGPPTAADDVDAFSVAEFCRRHGISPQLFYKFKDQMPATIRIGSRVLIPKEAAAAWRRERVAASMMTA